MDDRSKRLGGRVDIRADDNGKDTCKFRSSGIIRYNLNHLTCIDILINFIFVSVKTKVFNSIINISTNIFVRYHHAIFIQYLNSYQVTSSFLHIQLCITFQ